MIERTVGATRLVLLRGDITEQDTEIIVNAANSTLLGGGGVDGAIHRAGGPRILEECRVIRNRQGTCPAGQAVVTGGGRLKARYVVHAVGPVWSGGRKGEDDLLRSAYRNSLCLAVELKAGSISFPSISTGAYRFPIERASRLAVETVVVFVGEEGGLREVRFVVFSQDDYEVYAPLLRSAS